MNPKCIPEAQIKYDGDFMFVGNKTPVIEMTIHLALWVYIAQTAPVKATRHI